MLPRASNAKAGGPPSYTNHQDVGTWVRVFSSALTKTLRQKLNASEFLSFQLDESSDVTKQEQLIVYVTYVGACQPTPASAQLWRIRYHTHKD